MIFAKRLDKWRVNFEGRMQNIKMISVFYVPNLELFIFKSIYGDTFVP